MNISNLTDGCCGICANCVPQINGGSGFATCEEAHAAETAGGKMHFTKEQLITRIERQIDVNVTIIERLGDDSAATSELAVKTATMDIKVLDVALAALTAEPVVYRNKDTGRVCNANWLGNHSPASLGFEPLYRLSLIEGLKQNDN